MYFLDELLQLLYLHYCTLCLIRVATYFDGPTLIWNVYMNHNEIHCIYYTSVGHLVYWLCPTQKRYLKIKVENALIFEGFNI